MSRPRLPQDVAKTKDAVAQNAGRFERKSTPQVGTLPVKSLIWDGGSFHDELTTVPRRQHLCDGAAYALFGPKKTSRTKSGSRWFDSHTARCLMRCAGLGS